MGWGYYENWAVIDKKKRKKGPKTSNILKYVRLKVSNRKFNTKNFFGTEVNKTKFEPILKQCNTKNYKKLKYNETHINNQKTLRDTLGAIQNCRHQIKASNDHQKDYDKDKGYWYK